MKRVRTPIGALLPFLLMGMGSAHTELDPWKPAEKKPPPAPPERDELNRKARKVYARVMRETGDREAAIQAAKEVEDEA